MKTFLVLTDLTENSANAYRYAVQLACQVQANIKLVFCTNGVALSITNHLLYSQRLQSFAKRYACLSGQKTNQLHTECLISGDKWLEALPLLTNVHQPDLIIAGSGILEQLEEGRLPMQMEPFEQFPILWVPEKSNYLPLKKLVYVTDYTDQDPATIDQLKAFASLFNSEVSLIHFYTLTDRVRLSQIKKEGAILHKLIKATGVRYFLKEEDDLVEGLDEFSEDNPVDLFIFATRDSHLVHQYLKTVYRKTQANHNTIPLLNLYQAKKKPCAGNCSYCHKHEVVHHNFEIAQ